MRSLDKKQLHELFEKWRDLHGYSLKNFRNIELTFAKINTELKNPNYNELTSTHFLILRKKKIDQGVAPKTLNNWLGYLNSMFNFLVEHRLLEINKLKQVRKLRVPELELEFLNLKEINLLLGHLRKNDKDLFLATKVCLATGCRWSEAFSFRLYANKITFVNTKSNKNRSVAVNERLHKELEQWETKKLNVIALRKRFGARMRKLKLDRYQQSTHILRHTFASHFVMNGGDILSLQRILGHATLDMTMRYAHLSEAHNQDSVKYNPLQKSLY